jgi:isoamylase
VAFALPYAPSGGRWHLVADTMRPTPNEFLEAGEEIPLQDQTRYCIGPRSSVILLARP